LRFFRIRILRNLLIALIALLSLAVLANYLQKWRQRSAVVKPVREILSAELLRSANNFDHIAWENGIKKFRVFARKLIENRKGKVLLEGIEANDFNPDGSERHHITSRSGEYETDSKQVFFSGDVRLRLGKNVHLGMDTLHYGIGDQAGYSDGVIQLEMPQASGTARGVRYSGGQHRIELLKDLNYIIQRRIQAGDGSQATEEYLLTADHGDYSEPDRLLQITGQARLKTQNGTLAGDRIEAALGPDGKRISSIACHGNAVYESESAGEARTMRGDLITFDLNQETKALENIHVLGQAAFVMKFSGGEQKLTGSEIHLKMDPVRNAPQQVQSIRGVTFEFVRAAQRTSGSSEWFEAGFEAGGSALTDVHIRDHANMRIAGASGAGDELSAEDIRLSFRTLQGRSVPQALQAERSVEWTSPGRNPSDPSRTLHSNALTMRYADGGDFLESGQASGGVVLTAAPKPGIQSVQVRRLQCDKSDFSFYPGNNKLRGMTGDGNVQVLYRKAAEAGNQAADEEYRTASSRIRAQFREVDGSLETLSQSGNFTFQDGTRTAQAGNCDFSDATQTMILTGRPKITDPESSTSGEQIDYDRIGKVMIARRNVQSVMKSAAGKSQGFITSGQDASEPALVTADEMRYWTEEAKAQYTGNVHLLSADNQLQAQSLLILNRGEIVEAEGGIRHFMEKFSAINQKGSGPKGETSKTAKAENQAKTGDPVLIRSNRMQYSRASGRIHYSGNVSLDTTRYRIQSDVFDVFLNGEGNQVTRAKAAGKVVITQAVWVLRGAEADYDPISGIMIVTGDPVEYLDFANKDKPTSSKTPRLTFHTTDGRILLDGK
jgi:LPS export ABC transporter protein LptC